MPETLSLADFQKRYSGQSMSVADFQSKYGVAPPPAVPGMEKLGGTPPPAGQAPGFSALPPTNWLPAKSPGVDVPMLRSMNETVPMVPAMATAASVLAGGHELATHPLSVLTSLATAGAAHKGAKMLGAPDILADVAGLAGGVAGGLGANRITSLVREMPSDVASSLPFGKALKWYVSRGLPEPVPRVPPPPLMKQNVEYLPKDPSVPPPPLMKQATETLPAEPSVPPPPLMRQRVVTERAAPRPKKIPPPPLMKQKVEYLPEEPPAPPPAAPGVTAEQVAPVQAVASLGRLSPERQAAAQSVAERLNETIPPPPGGSPVPPNAATFKHSAPHTDLIRQIHAVTKEMPLEGSPAGANAHPLLSDAAKKIFGVKSLSELTYDQLQKMNEFILKNKRIPAVGDIKPGP